MGVNHVPGILLARSPESLRRDVERRIVQVEPKHQHQAPRKHHFSGVQRLWPAPEDSPAAGLEAWVKAQRPTVWVILDLHEPTLA